MFSTVIATRERPEYLANTLKALEKIDCQDVVVVTNGCTKTERMLKKVPYASKLKLVVLPENIGAGRGKQRGIMAAEFDKVLVLDDDALMCNDVDIAYCLAKLDEYSLVQGLILADENGARRRNEQPFIFRKNRQGDHEISYFVGALHFLNRQEFLSVGGYEKAALYGFEELELSLNLLFAGKRMLFSDKCSVVHVKAPGGRQNAEELALNILHARNRISAEYFPWFVSLICQIFWNIKLLPKTRRFSFTKQNGNAKFRYLDFIRVPRLLSRAFA